jgi:hypothetical protein
VSQPLASKSLKEMSEIGGTGAALRRTNVEVGGVGFFSKQRRDGNNQALPKKIGELKAATAGQLWNHLYSTRTKRSNNMFIIAVRSYYVVARPLKSFCSLSREERLFLPASSLRRSTFRASRLVMQMITTKEGKIRGNFVCRWHPVRDITMK